MPVRGYRGILLFFNVFQFYAHRPVTGDLVYFTKPQARETNFAR